MNWYVINKDYIKYLMQFDSRVGYVEYGERLKLHIGILDFSSKINLTSERSLQLRWFLFSPETGTNPIDMLYWNHTKTDAFTIYEEYYGQKNMDSTAFAGDNGALSLEQPGAFLCCCQP